MQNMNWRLQMGTLGSGNHFIELEVDQEDGVWVMLHSGSRGAGNVMASRFIKEAKTLTATKGIELVDGALSYFEEGEEAFDRYMQAVHWAQNYARANRRTMVDDVIKSLEDVWPHVEPVGELIDCHHNYVEKGNALRRRGLRYAQGRHSCWYRRTRSRARQHGRRVLLGRRTGQ